MKCIIISTVCAILLAALSSCADSIEDIEGTFSWGIEKAEQAQSIEELCQITVDVRNKLINGAKGIGGDRKLSQEERERYHAASDRYQAAVNEACYRLTGQQGNWGYLGD